MQASKEDKANKVTSINADADDVHYPTAKAVKDSLEKVKNIEVTPDMLSESTKQFINASIGGTITNFADDEDLTTVDNALKLADKAYDPITYSGMGRKYLRKNLVDGKNILTQAMLPSANTIYIIQYDYDLNGATITIPENCTLDFQGGSLVNGTLSFSHTYIESSEKSIFNAIAANGTLVNTNIYCTWFGNFDDETDAAVIINRALSFCGGLSSNNKEVFLPNRALDVYTTINIITAVCINGNHKKGRTGSTTIYACTPGMEVFKTSVRFCDSVLKNVDIKNKNDDTLRNYIGVEMQAGESFVVENVKVYNANIAFDLSTEYEISLCRLENISAINCLIGLKVNEINNGWINGLSVRPNWFTNNNIGIDINGGVNTTIEGGNCEIGRDESTHDWMTDNLGINIYGKAKVNIIGCVWGENYHPIFGKVSQQAKLYVTGDSHIISPIVTEDDATISVVNDLFLTSPYSQLTNKKPIIDFDYKFIAYNGTYWSHFINKIDGAVYKFMNLRTKRQNWLDYDVPYSYGIVSDQFVEGELSSNWTFILDFVIPNSKEHFVLTLYRESVANNMQFVIPGFDKNINARLLYTNTSDGVYKNRLSLPFGDEDINEPQRVRLGIILAENKLKFVYDNFVQTDDINIDGFLNFNAKNFLISGGCYVLGIQVYNEALSSKEVRHLLSHYKPGNKDNLTGPTSNRPTTAPVGYKYYDTTIGADVVMKDKVYTEIVTPKWGLNINTSASRPTLYTGGHKGYQFFDTTLNKPIWWTGSAWVDATGAEV